MIESRSIIDFMARTMILPFQQFARYAVFLTLVLPGCKHDMSRNHHESSPIPVQTMKADPLHDPYLWLEEVTGEKSLEWVRTQNALSTRELESSPEFSALKERTIRILDSRDKIPFVSKHGPHYYNFWRDQKHVRGVFRRTSLVEFRKPSPEWETVLDLDQLASSEKENWVWKGYSVLEPDRDRCLVALSRGGADATIRREFDLTKKAFVENGFKLPEAKSNVAWRDRNTLYVATDYGPGSLTKSGYPRVAKEWSRGTPLSSARVVFEGTSDDVSAGVSVSHDHGKIYEIAHRAPSFFTTELFVRRGADFIRIEKPADVRVNTFGEWMLLEPRLDWKLGGNTYKGGSLLAIGFESYMKGSRDFTVLFEPTDRKSLASVSSTRNFLILNELDNVRSRPALLRFDSGKWTRTAMEAPAYGNVSVHGIDDDESDDYFMTVADFLTPSSLYLGTAGKPGRELLKSLPGFFNVEGLEIAQFEATSKDGTKIPYFQVSRKGMKLNAANPTLLYGYGGFEISMQPNYSPVAGSAWLEKGGVYVLANIRGGGEFGPSWHNAARKANRQRAYDDFIAVAESLISRKVTSPRHLGIQGGSNGGLLVGVMLTQRPELFGAVVCQVPLLDMRRFNKLLAGASWMDEYGDPDKPEEWEFIQHFSPYHNLSKSTKYPRVLFTTSTRDDRVHPGHARKMVARMKEQGHDVLYYENIEGGHGGSANNQQAAYMSSLAYTFLWNQLK